MKTEEIRNQIIEYKNRNLSLFTTSSFQSHSIVLLHILSTIDKTIPIYFINTGYHFPETISFKDKIVKLLDINVINLESFIPKNLQRDSYGNLLFTSDPDYCCFLNKVQPMETLLLKYDVWINGIRGDQSAHRKKFQTEEVANHNTLRYHPMLNWSSKDIYYYRMEHKLPAHPLEEKGYLSIGCEPCTRKFIGEDGRDGRWYGMNKSECGLNTDLVAKKETY